MAIKIKRSTTASAVPSSLVSGEIAINEADGKMYYRATSGTVTQFSTPTISHTHGNITYAGAIGSTANLPVITSTSGVLTTGSFGTSAATFCEGNDSRLSDTRTPTDGSVTTAKIANDAVTYAKLQNVSATDRLLGRSSAGSGDVEEITCTAFGRSLIDDADAAAARSTLSVQPTASPAFTGTVSAAAANFTGAVSVTSPLTLTGTVAGNVRQIKLQTSGVDRWQITPSFDAETGSNAGSNFHITRWSDAGSFLGTPLYITRSTGVVNCESGLTIVSGQLLVTTGSASAPGVSFSGDANTGEFSPAADNWAVATGGTERVRIDAGGNVLVNTTSGDPAGTNATSGCCIAPSSYISVTRSAAPCLYVNRKTDDGTIVSIHQDGTAEGSISVSGTTVSYNAFCGSHWAQLIDNSRPSILRGTVLETIDEMCEWPEGKSDRLVRVKVSDTPRSRRVYGVFMGWDEEYASTGDLYATALGAYMVRVSGVVQSGDLLESAGDGTARTQSDDIVRSSTIGKVSSTHRVAEYDDGSYLVPCVLMCG